MKVGKHYLGKVVEVTWRDPVGISRKDLTAPTSKGLTGLATWIERGLLDDITDGIVRIRHSDSFLPGSTAIDEATITLIPEFLIEKIVAFEAGQAQKDESQGSTERG